MSTNLPEWIGLHKYIRLVSFSGTIVNVEPLRIGAGRAVPFSEPTELIVVKMQDAQGRVYPFIPGSSIKGALRSYVVKLMKSAGLEVCDGVPMKSCLKGNEFEYYDRRGAPPEEVITAIAEGKIRLCAACLIFGSPSFSSHIRVHDALPLEVNYRLGYRTMVAIDRRTGAALPRALFTVEYVEPNAKFSFKIDFVNLPNYLIGAVAESLLDIDMALLKLGGLKSRGFGAVKIENLKVEVYSYKSRMCSTVAEALDALDRDVKLTGNWREDLNSFANVWRSSIPKLQSLSKSGWRWIDVVSGRGKG